jgi:hypothetical protein
MVGDSGRFKISKLLLFSFGKGARLVSWDVADKSVERREKPLPESGVSWSGELERIVAESGDWVVSLREYSAFAS